MSKITSKQLFSISTTKGGYCRTQISSSYLYKRICPKMHEDASLAAGPCFPCNGRPSTSVLLSILPPLSLASRFLLLVLSSRPLFVAPPCLTFGGERRREAKRGGERPRDSARGGKKWRGSLRKNDLENAI